MKISIREKEYTIWAVLAIIIVIVWAIVIWMLIESYSNNEKAFLNIELKRFEGEVQSTLKTYEAFSNYIYDEIAQDNEIIEIIYQANNASDDDEKNELRQQLYTKVEDKYVNMKKYEFRQFHFHLSNTESFLRMHAPERYGDLLIDVRQSIKYANQKQEYVSGFEEGRIYNGFRFVYPLEYEGDHIGTVEASISSASILEVLSNLYTEEDFHFIIDKSVVEGTVFDSEQENYSDSLLSNDYYIDKDVEKITEAYNTIIPLTENLFFLGLKNQYADLISSQKSFSVIYKYNSNDYIVKFLSIKNTGNEPVAYLISLAETYDYKHLAYDMYKQIALVSFLAIFIIVFGLILAFYQHRLKDASELDYLTKIYNRHKFYDLVEKEMRRSARYGYSSSVMLMDIDYFKNINDSHGHEWGDQVLKELSTLVLKNIRVTDFFARWGGEEFVFLLPHTNKKEALQMAEKIRKLVDETKTNKLQDVTVSIGVAIIDPQKYDIDFTIHYADEAMYHAKENGRNQVCCSDTNIYK